MLGVCIGADEAKDFDSTLGARAGLTRHSNIELNNRLVITPVHKNSSMVLLMPHFKSEC